MGIVQTALGTNNSGNCSVSFANNITAGNTVIICIAGGAPTSGTGLSVAPASGGDTFTQEVFDSGAHASSIWAKISSAGGYKQVNFSNGINTNAINVWMYEVAGITGLDQTSNSGSGFDTGTFTSGTTATTSQASEIWFGVGGGIFCSSSSATASGPSSPWVNEASQTCVIVGHGYPDISGHQIVSSTGTATYSGSFTFSSSNGYTGCVATFKISDVTVSLTVAQVTINAPAPQPPLFLPRAQITISALAPVVTYSLSLPRARINVAAPAIQPRIALTLLAALAARAGTDDSGATFTQGFTGKTTAFQPGSNPLAFEAAHNMPAMAASWAVGAGGQAKYMFDSNGNLEFAFVLRTIGTLTDATVIWSAGSVPPGYRPPVAKYWPVTVIGTYVVSGNTPALLFGTDGSIAVYGISASTVTGIDAHGVLPLNL